MSDTPLSSLDSRQQRLLANAQRALEKGNAEYVVTACGEILNDHPGCLPVRQLQRVAQLRGSVKGGWMGKAVSGLTNLPFSLGGKSGGPEKSLARAEKILSEDPRSLAGLKLLAEASSEFEWPETVAFALEAIREIEPENRDNLLALGEAWLAADKPDQSLKVADALLRLNPVDGEAQSLMRKASIARTTDQGHWDEGGDYLDKLMDESESIALEKQSAPAETHSPNAKTEYPSIGEAEPKADPLETAQNFVASYPGDLDGRYRLAQLLFKSEQTEEAIAEYQQTQKNPKLRVSSLLGMARCFRKRGLIDLAVAQLSTAKSELSGMDDLKKEVIYELGCCYESLEKQEEAITEFKAIYTEDIGFRDVAKKINQHYAS